MNRTKWFAAAFAVVTTLAPVNIGFAAGDGATQGGDVGTGAVNEPFLQPWNVVVTPDEHSLQEGRNAFKDMVLFESDGFFTAEAFGPLGFGRSQYTLTSLADGVTGFTTTMSNGQQGTLVWNGVLEGNHIVGTLVWTKPDGTVGTYDFNATPAE